VKLLRFTQGGGPPRLGVLDDDGSTVLDLSPAGLPADTAVLLAGGPDALDRVRAVVAARREVEEVALADVRLLAPVPRPPKFLAIGLNYADHVAESATWSA
jgi:2-keto-4-pentenoate hydratase/2-oxohepta-3-ene-1,7-dioic acid hydratase in catechol pathway